jgi:hypothetical protein
VAVDHAVIDATRGRNREVVCGVHRCFRQQHAVGSNTWMRAPRAATLPLK